MLEADRALWTTSCPLVENPEIDGNSVARVGVPIHRAVVPALAGHTDLVSQAIVTGFNGVGVNPEGQLLIPVSASWRRYPPPDTHTSPQHARCGPGMPSKALIPLRRFISGSRGGSGMDSTWESLTTCLC